MDLAEHRRMVADGAISAYKATVMCMMMADYDLITGAAHGRPTDGMSCPLEESVMELEENAEKSHGSIKKKLAESDRKLGEVSKNLRKPPLRLWRRRRRQLMPLLLKKILGVPFFF